MPIPHGPPRHRRTDKAVLSRWQIPHPVRDCPLVSRLNPFLILQEGSPLSSPQTPPMPVSVWVSACASPQAAKHGPTLREALWGDAGEPAASTGNLTHSGPSTSLQEETPHFAFPRSCWLKGAESMNVGRQDKQKSVPLDNGGCGRAHCFLV